MATCPHCESNFSFVKAEPVSVKAKGNAWKGISYACPSCGMSLSVTIDQVALKTDIVEEILRALGKQH